MGGIGSGRWGGKPTVGGGLSLDLNDLLRNGSLKRNATTAGVLTWPRRSGEQVACIGYRATLSPERGDLFALVGYGPEAGARAVDRAAIDHPGPRRKTMVVRLLQRPRLEAPPAGTANRPRRGR